MTEPKFEPKPGQVDYTNIRYAPVIQCVLKYGNKLLILQRSKEMNLFPGYWSGIAGFLDDDKEVEDKIYEELNEEIGLSPQEVESIKHGSILAHNEKQYNKTFIIFPALVEVKTDKIRLDWEASDFRWVSPEEAKKMHLMPGFDKVLREFFN